MRYVPAPGLKVRDPATRQWIGDDGVEVGPHDFDLARMIAQGDLVEAAPARPAAPLAPASAAKGSDAP